MKLKQILIGVFTPFFMTFIFVKASGFESKVDNGRLSQNPILDSIVKFEKGRVIKLADSFLTLKPITVTSDFCPRSAGGKHDYYSEGTYWWPNPANPDGPYIQKDGQNNPDNFDAHGKNVMRFAWIVGTETSAYLLTGSEKYAKAALNHINAWLVDTTTRMNPNMLYAQAIKGVCTGRGIGVIDAAPLIEVAQSITILERSPYAKGQDIFQAKDWFKQYLTWLTTHKYGVDELNWKNNHGTWANCQAAAYARLVGNEQVLQECRKRYTDVILPKQMATDGSFPLEIARTKPFGYSLFNLDGFAILATLLTDNSFDGWNYKLPDGRGMSKGAEFMMPFIKDKNSWTYKKDVLHWEVQPSRQPFMLFAAANENQIEWFNLWKNQNVEFANDEIRRNLPLKNPLLWLGLPIPLAGKTYSNPIIPGFNPDPSICRVGEDYYLVTSTFEYFPGVPIYHSNDLVNWEMIGHVLNRPSQLNLDSINCSGGIYAPTIRYNNGTFYMITTLVGSTNTHRNFIVTAKKPEGPWSEPHWIADAPGIDPSLFFDDNGKVYYSGNVAPKNKVFDKHRNIWVQELDIKTWKLIGQKVDVLDGGEYYANNKLGSVNNYEASHIYKKDSKYYLLIAHGGTSQNHAVSIWRCSNIFGPYEINPANPILTHRDLSKELYFTSTGHADLVQTQKGEWWMVYLAKRPYGGENHIMGRETFMSPVNWKGEWPIVNPTGSIGRGEVMHFRPSLKENKIKVIGAKDDFDSKKLQNQWTFIRTPRTEWWSLKSRKGFLRINLRPETIADRANPSFIGIRQQHVNCTTITKMEFNPLASNEDAGLVVERDKDNYLKFTVSKEGNQFSVHLSLKNGVDKKESTGSTAAINSGSLYLKVIAKGTDYGFYYSYDGNTWDKLEHVDGKFLGFAGAGRFTGTFIGMYASSNGVTPKNYVDFDWFEYKEN